MKLGIEIRGNTFMSHVCLRGKKGASINYVHCKYLPCEYINENTTFLIFRLQPVCHSMAGQLADWPPKTYWTNYE